MTMFWRKINSSSVYGIAFHLDQKRTASASVYTLGGDWWFSQLDQKRTASASVYTLAENSFESIDHLI